MENQDLEKRILVIEDKPKIREYCITNGQGIVEAPEINLRVDPEATKLKEAMFSKKYGVILMDGDLGSSEENGPVITELIRKGEYFGNLNQDTRIISFSSMGNVKGCEPASRQIIDLKNCRNAEAALKYIRENYF